MAGKFLNTTHNDNLNRMVFGLQNIIKNPYYKWLSQTPTTVTYFNKSIEGSTLDEGAKIQYSETGDTSPFQYNKINDMYLYGIERISVQLENDDFGLTNNPVEGEALILPGTITPYAGDFFTINYLKEKTVIFKVLNATYDTLENGSNFYKIQYKLDSQSAANIENNIKDTYNMIINNVGTKFNPIIRSEKYDLIKELETVLINLKKYYKALFYSDRVQTFVFKYNERYFYDPALIEFISNNELMEGDDEYIYIDHKLPVPPTFALTYDRTIFHMFEKRDFKNIRRYKYNAVGRYIDAKTSIFASRPEEYFCIDFRSDILDKQLLGNIACFSEDFINYAETGTLFLKDDPRAIYNSIIKFMNGNSIMQDDLDLLEYMDYSNNETIFYAIPCIIYCIEAFIKELLIKSET